MLTAALHLLVLVELSRFLLEARPVPLTLAALSLFRLELLPMPMVVL